EEESRFLESEGLGGILEAVQAGRLSEADAPGLFRQSWAQSLRNYIVARDPSLNAFSSSQHDRSVATYRASDREHIETARERVLRSAAERAFQARADHPEQAAEIKKQAKLKRRHKTLRQLLNAAPDVLSAVRPCWVMSPLVVAQLLPPEPLFDVVVFDEASQIRPEEAVSSILRGRQTVVAGDPRQLPPSNFFVAGDDDEEDGSEAEDEALVSGFESILDVLGALLREFRLDWHYRSEDERLIAFSNYNIYDGSLTTFPATQARSPLIFRKVDHIPAVSAQTKSNDAEVETVVDLMIRHVDEHPEESLGVITMGIHHAHRIEDELWRRLREEQDPELDEYFDPEKRERAFVKSIESVQGDERDSIILSVGYGKDPTGNVPYRFGPINQEGGERRLNVAASRARRRMTVVSSISHNDMDDSRTSKEGAILLRRLLKFAASRGEDLDGADSRPPLNPFESDVKRRLEAAGLNPIPQYGASRFRIDFALPDPDEPDRMVLAVEADGASYHSSPTARDRDRLRQQVLEKQGWRFHRIWSTDWFRDPLKETERVVSAFEAALAGDDEIEHAPVAAPTEPSVTAGRSGTKPHFVRGRPIDKYDHAQLVALVRWIDSDTLLRDDDEVKALMLDELGFKRRGNRIDEAFTRSIQAARSGTGRKAPASPARPTPKVEERRQPPAPPTPARQPSSRARTTPPPHPSPAQASNPSVPRTSPPAPPKPPPSPPKPRHPPPPSMEPGWYADPRREAMWRYFDGAEWTESTEKNSGG
ncbi:MAG: DUF2510 domain-containing protein, partial [Gemmatimonadetes bacterium]|nr:DUF2510 domain-containing protein [Gemmatimonadota bacterium]